MSHNLDSLVQTQMAVPLLNGSITTEYLGSKTDIKPVGKRRVFVQTETGCVLGIELERGDSAQTVKRRLQLALNVPTEESSLTFGDVVLKNDLSVVRKDSPLLLTRNLIHRSSSTPCLSPGGKDLQQHCWSGPVEIVGCSSHCSRTKQLVKEITKAIRTGVQPILVHGGLGGAYYFKNCRGERVAIVKPTDEEPFAPNNPKGFVGKALGQPGLKRSVRVGETGFREVAAYLLDHEHFANVPPTFLVKITHSIFNVNDLNGCSNRTHDMKPSEMSKIASLQQFIPHDFDASDHGTSSFPVSAVHRIGILDIRIFNTDRHGGNLLLRKLHGDVAKFGGQMELIPIDHGLCLPESFEDPYFEWIHWPQASIPFSKDELEYIDKLDPIQDASMLRNELPMIREACLRVLILCTTFLKEAAKHGLCLAEIGEMMSREFKGMDEEPSKLEMICLEARRSIVEHDEESFNDDYEEEEEFQFDIDCDEYDDVIPKVLTSYSGIGNGRNPLCKLDEYGEEEEDENHNNVLPLCSFHLPPGMVSELSMSLNAVSISEKSRRVQSSRQKGIYPSKSIYCKGCNTGSGGFQGGNSRSANEPLPSSPTFVTVADMGEEKWSSFLDKFYELLPDAFEEHKCGATSLRQRQRLGTSCQF